MRRPLLLIVACMAAGFGQPLPLEGIAHVGFGVRNSDRSGAYYAGTLGLARAFKTSNGGASIR